MSVVVPPPDTRIAPLPLIALVTLFCPPLATVSTRFAPAARLIGPLMVVVPVVCELPKLNWPPALTLMALLIVPPETALTMLTLPGPDIVRPPVPETPPLTFNRLAADAERTVLLLSCSGAWM